MEVAKLLLEHGAQVRLSLAPTVNDISLTRLNLSASC